MHAAGNPKTLRRDLFVGLLCGAFVALMGGLSYAAVPFYSWFSRAGGIGATEAAGALPRQQSPRLVTVRFDSDVGLRRSLRSSPDSVDAELGQVVSVSTGRISVQAGVGSPTAGFYFETIKCLCGAPQTMQFGGGRDMPFVPADDCDQDGVSTITFFYTFYTVRAPVPPGQRPPASGPARRPGRI